MSSFGLPLIQSLMSIYAQATQSPAITSPVNPSPNAVMPSLTGLLDTASPIATNINKETDFTVIHSMDTITPAIMDTGSSAITYMGILGLLSSMFIQVMSSLQSFMGQAPTPKPVTASTPTPAPTDPNIEVYNGVKINKQGFSDDELTEVKTVIDKMQTDPDGKILLDTLAAGGGEIKRDRTTSPPGRAWASGGSLTFGNDAFSGDMPDLMEVLGHELTHVVSQNVSPTYEDTLNEEVLASTLGRRIRFRANGNQPFEVDQNGQKYIFDGTEKAEQISYSLAIQKLQPTTTLKIDNDKIFNLLKQVGVTFNINHNGSAPLPN